MNLVIVAWVNGSTVDFERHIPLLWSGVRNRRLGSENRLTVLFLDGLLSLEEQYRERLKVLGYTLVDGSANYRHYLDKFPQLARFGDYEQKCFLRWLVIRDFFGSDPVIHLDGDLVFNATPEQLARDFGAETFVLQGCPAFVSTGKSDWLDSYAGQLKTFADNIDDYSSVAWLERAGWEQSSREKWSGARFRKIISSDQDFISHLLHTDRLPQQRPESVRAVSELVLFENPLYFFEYCSAILPVGYERIDGIDYFNGKKIAFWHMQSDFIRYLLVCAKRADLRIGGRHPNILNNVTVTSLLWRCYLRFNSFVLKRIPVYQRYFEHGDFSGILNDTTFWKNDVCR